MDCRYNRENIHLTRLKDKITCGVFEILHDQLDQKPKVKLNEKVTFSPKNKNKSKIEKCH